MGNSKSRAVVLGGSIAGLFAARVLTESHDEVVVIDRDVLVGTGGPRRGRPQGRHINAMHVRGRVVMEELYPGITDELIADETPAGDFAGACRWYFNGHALKREDIGYLAVPATAPVMERHIRERTQVLPGVRFLEERAILGLVTTPDRSRVTGVRVEPTAGGAEEVVEADLVVDATGRGSRTPVWLEELGYGRVEEERKKIGLTYCTQHYRLEADPWDGDLAIIPVAHPAVPRGAIFTKTDHGRVELTVYGLLGDAPPTDQQGYYDFVKSLPVPDIHEALQHAVPLDEPVSYRYPTTIRRHYQKVPKLPEGLLVTGDAVTSFNPVYAQGMTVAALSSLVIRDHVRAHGSARTEQYFAALAREVIDAPWEMTNTVDLSFPGVVGERTLKVRIGQKYLKRVQIAATRDTKVTTAYMRAAGMLERPESLMKPLFMLRVLWKSLRGPAANPPLKPVVPADGRQDRRAA
ncbi:FAD-dependent oxidoreductase [Amycolatopsis sp. NPDC004747]